MAISPEYISRDGEMALTLLKATPKWISELTSIRKAKDELFNPFLAKLDSIFKEIEERSKLSKRERLELFYNRRIKEYALERELVDLILKLQTFVSPWIQNVMVQIYEMYTPSVRHLPIPIKRSSISLRDTQFLSFLFHHLELSDFLHSIKIPN